MSVGVSELKRTDMGQSSNKKKLDNISRWKSSIRKREIGDKEAYWKTWSQKGQILANVWIAYLSYSNEIAIVLIKGILITYHFIYHNMRKSKNIRHVTFFSYWIKEPKSLLSLFHKYVKINTKMMKIKIIIKCNYDSRVVFHLK